MKVMDMGKAYSYAGFSNWVRVLLTEELNHVLNGQPWKVLHALAKKDERTLWMEIETSITETQKVVFSLVFLEDADDKTLGIQVAPVTESLLHTSNAFWVDITECAVEKKIAKGMKIDLGRGIAVAVLEVIECLEDSLHPSSLTELQARRGQGRTWRHVGTHDGLDLMRQERHHLKKCSECEEEEDKVYVN